MSELESILNKIKKCLALSKSCNEHEAAIALKQAQRLMQAHNISVQDVDAAQAQEKLSKASAKYKPSKWENDLAYKVADAFSCKIIFHSGWGPVSHWGFIGCGPAPEICQYAFTVLLRQVKKARTLHIQNKLRYCKPAAKTKRADLFCRGWVESAGRAVTRFAGNDEQIKAIDAFMSKNYPNLGELQTRDRTDKKLKAYEYQDYLTGKEEGKQVELNHGVGAANKPLSIENCEAI